MTAKVEIIKLLGEQAVLLPSLIAEALNANDRIKVRLTMLQEAAAHASSVGSAAPTLQVERRASGLSDPQFDRAITGARLLDGDRIAIPGVAGLLAAFPSIWPPCSRQSKRSIRKAENPCGRGWSTCKRGFPPLQTARLAAMK